MFSTLFSHFLSPSSSHPTLHLCRHERVLIAVGLPLLSAYHYSLQALVVAVTARISSNTSNQGLPLIACGLGGLSTMRWLKVRQPRHTLYVTVNSRLSPSITTPPPFFYLHITPALSLSITHAHIYLQDWTGNQVIRSSDHIIKQLSGGSVCGVTSGSRFDRQELCGSGVMSRVELLAPRVDLHGNTSSQRVYFSSSPSLPLSSLSLPSLPPPLPPSLSSLANSK